MMRWAPSQAILDAALAHAERDQPRECCGLVIDGAYRPMRNVSPEPTGAFLIDSRDMLDVLQAGGVEAVVHSHVFLPPLASEADRTACEASGLPWLIVSWPNLTHAVIEPSGFRAPLIGRMWAWRVHDCYALVRDGLSDYAGIVLPDIDRQWEFWNQPDRDFVREMFPPLGFVELPPEAPLQQCDFLVMKIHAKHPNHLAMFLAPDRILHQMSRRYSVVEMYGGVYQQLTALRLRHRYLMEGMTP